MAVKMLIAPPDGWVPWWLAIVLAALAGELVASVLYVTTPALYGRVLGIIVGVAAFLLNPIG